MYKKFYILPLLLVIGAVNTLFSADEPVEELPSRTAQMIKLATQGSVAGLSGYAGAQCLMAASLFNPAQYKQFLGIVENSLQTLQNNPKLLQVLVWFFEKRNLSPDDLKKSVAIINECKLYADTCKPLAYMSTGAFAAVSAYFAYNFIQNSKELYSLWAEAQQGDLPERQVTIQQPSLIKTAGYAGMALSSAAALKYVCETPLWHIEVFNDLLDITETVLDKARSEIGFAETLIAALGKPLSLSNQVEFYSSQLQPVIRPLIKATKPGLYVAGGMLSLLALYTTYKVVVDGYTYIKSRQRPAIP